MISPRIIYSYIYPNILLLPNQESRYNFTSSFYSLSTCIYSHTHLTFSTQVFPLNCKSGKQSYREIYNPDVTSLWCRRIVIAVLQFITYDEYLPFIVGGEQMDCHNLRVYNSSRYTQYNNRIDASMASSFSTAAYRYGHSMVQTIIPMWQSNNRLLRNTFFQPFDLYQDILDDMIKGSSYSGIAELVDPHLVTDITEFLYRTPPTAPFGQDLASLNVNRGRDHGLQPYVKYLELCTYTRVTTFNQLYDFMPSENVRRLRNTYRLVTGFIILSPAMLRDVRDIDLFSGGLSEYPVRGGVVGPTFACIIARQFARLKHGDRFYFEHGGQTGSFTLSKYREFPTTLMVIPDQLAEIKKMTLSKIFCLVTNIDFIQKYSMERIN
ncbi:hypothetical protein LAZ67_2006372 [Cordylochernes scorpioides]|uniref:Prostaglandin-endoperoxide synthase n=1 Tax=Cordylochernes scorpioides TaxID=51811 RepID=A0ABY6K9V0_9ARAC|nr:hypothetical protein LAZ67_2006372 [Cordylochernes scorpioides]